MSKNIAQEARTDRGDMAANRRKPFESCKCPDTNFLISSDADVTILEKWFADTARYGTCSENWTAAKQASIKWSSVMRYSRGYILVRERGDFLLEQVEISLYKNIYNIVVI